MLVLETSTSVQKFPDIQRKKKKIKFQMEPQKYLAAGV